MTRLSDCFWSDGAELYASCLQILKSEQTFYKWLQRPLSTDKGSKGSKRYLPQREQLIFAQAVGSNVEPTSRFFFVTLLLSSAASHTPRVNTRCLSLLVRFKISWWKGTFEGEFKELCMQVALLLGEGSIAMAGRLNWKMIPPSSLDLHIHGWLWGARYFALDNIERFLLLLALVFFQEAWSKSPKVSRGWESPEGPKFSVIETSNQSVCDLSKYSAYNM